MEWVEREEENLNSLNSKGLFFQIAFAWGGGEVPVFLVNFEVSNLFAVLPIFTALS